MTKIIYFDEKELLVKGEIETKLSNTQSRKCNSSNTRLENVIIKIVGFYIFLVEYFCSLDSFSFF